VDRQDPPVLLEVVIPELKANRVIRVSPEPMAHQASLVRKAKAVTQDFPVLRDQ